MQIYRFENEREDGRLCKWGGGMHGHGHVIRTFTRPVLDLLNPLAGMLKNTGKYSRVRGCLPLAVTGKKGGVEIDLLFTRSPRDETTCPRLRLRSSTAARTNHDQRGQVRGLTHSLCFLGGKAD